MSVRWRAVAASIAITGLALSDATARSPQPAVPTSQPAAAITTEAIAPLPPAIAAMPERAARVVPVSFADLPGWLEDDHLAAFKAFVSSCPRVQAIAKSPPSGVRPPVPAGLLAACEAALAAGKMSRIDAKAFFERHFQPQRLVHAAAQGLLTGYYEPLIEGSRTRDGRFQTPLYRRPSDLVNIVDETQRAAAAGGFTHMRKTTAGLVPHASRAEIDGGALNGKNLELLYVADQVDKFFLQVQGSGRVRLQDGTIIRVHYDGKNGHPYTSIGRYLIDKGIVPADKMSMGALGRWLRSDEKRGQQVMQQNASYVFFKELPNDAAAPLGALLAPLTTGRSLAVDPRFHILGSPVYVSAPTLTHAQKGRPFHRLMIAHDVGSAIKGPERGDIYFGSGEAAGRVAGVTKHPGHLFVMSARVPDTEPVAASSSAAKQAKR